MRWKLHSDITVGDLTAHGVEAGDAHCEKCGNLWRVAIDILPSATTLSRVASLIACPKCGGRNVEMIPPPTEDRRFDH